MKRAGRIIVFAGVVVVAVVVLAAVIIPGQIAPQLERRLAEETGLTWSIGGAHLSPALSLDLSDVSARDPADTSGAPLFTAKALALSGPPRLAFGGAGTISIAASSVSTRMSGGVWQSGKAPTGALAHPSDATLSVRGLRAQVSDQLTAASATAENLDATLRFDDGAARNRHFLVTLDAADAVTKIDLREANAASPLLADASANIAYTPKTGGPKVAFDAGLQVDGGNIRLVGLRGTLDGGAFTGTAGANVAATPSIEWNLVFDRFALIDDVNAAAPGNIPVGTPTIRASALKDVDLAWLDRVRVNGATRVSDAQIGNARAASVAAQTTIRDGVLDVAVTASKFYDGVARARYVLTRASTGGVHQIGLSIQKASALPLLSDLIGVRGFDGATTIRFDAVAKGDRLDEAVKTIAGAGDISVADGSINGLDLANTAGLSAGGLGQTAAGLMNTRFSRLTSTFRIDNGRAATNDLQFDTPIIDATGTGTVDLSTKTIDFTLHPALAGKGKARIDVPVRISGPWASPAVSTDFSGVMNNPGAALQSLQDLSGALGKGGGGALGGLGSALGGGGLGGLLDGIFPKGAPARR